MRESESSWDQLLRQHASRLSSTLATTVHAASFRGIRFRRQCGRAVRWRVSRAAASLAEAWRVPFRTSAVERGDLFALSRVARGKARAEAHARRGARSAFADDAPRERLRAFDEDRIVQRHEGLQRRVRRHAPDACRSRGSARRRSSCSDSAWCAARKCKARGGSDLRRCSSDRRSARR